MRFIIYAIFAAMFFMGLVCGCAPEAVKKSVYMMGQATEQIAKEASTPLIEGELAAARLDKISAITEDIEMLREPVQDYIGEPEEFPAYTPEAAEALAKTTKKVVALRLAFRNWLSKLKEKSTIIAKGAAAASTGWAWLEPVLYTLGSLGLLGGGVVAKKKLSNKKLPTKK